MFRGRDNIPKIEFALWNATNGSQLAPLYCVVKHDKEKNEKKRNNIIDSKAQSLEIEKLQKENIAIKQEREKIISSSPRKIDEKCLAYLLIEKIPELKESKNWRNLLKNNSTKGTIKQKMENMNLGIDGKSFEDILKRACDIYWRLQKAA